MENDLKEKLKILIELYENKLEECKNARWGNHSDIQWGSGLTFNLKSTIQDLKELLKDEK